MIRENDKASVITLMVSGDTNALIFATEHGATSCSSCQMVLSVISIFNIKVTRGIVRN